MTFPTFETGITQEPAEATGAAVDESAQLCMHAGPGVVERGFGGFFRRNRFILVQHFRTGFGHVTDKMSQQNPLSFLFEPP